ncbi:flavin-containing monooxygenase [Spirillospora sp. CA-108201]
MAQAKSGPAVVTPAAGPGGPYRVVVIGTGFSGLGMAIGLKKAGVHDFVILEKADEVGGTWRENTYPGCACDIMSLLYSYSFEPKSDWSRMFPEQGELLRYIKDVVDKYELAQHIRFKAEVTATEYDDATGTWQVTVNGGETVRGRALVAGMGPLHRPSIPAPTCPVSPRSRGRRSTPPSGTTPTTWRASGSR